MKLTMRLALMASLTGSFMLTGHVRAEPAAASCTRTAPTTLSLIRAGLLDPGINAATRQPLTGQLLCSAAAGNAWSQEVAGSLYRLGPDHPAKVFPRDPAKAQDLLTAAAMQGRRGAMFQLAEIELANGHPYEALVWSQIESYYYQNLHSETAKSGDGSYYAALLKRIYDALGDVDKNKVRVDVGERVAHMTAPAASAMNNSDGNDPTLRALPPSQRRWTTNKLADIVDGGWAQYQLEITPNGRISHAWLVAALPDAGAGLRLSRPLEQIRFAPLAAGDTHLRYDVLNLAFGNRRYRLNDR